MSKKATKRPYKAPAVSLATGVRLVIAGNEVTGMSPLQKAAMVKSRLAANKRRSVA